MNPISFKANYIKTVTVPQKTADGTFEPHDVCIVELDKHNSNDVNVLAKTAQEWDRVSSGFAGEIYSDVLKKELYPGTAAERYIALTEQQDNFEELDSKKILGLALMSEKWGSTNELNWLQVNPNTNSETLKDRKYKKIGTEIINYIKHITKKPLTLIASATAVPFYEKLGFTVLHPTIAPQMMYEDDSMYETFYL